MSTMLWACKYTFMSKPLTDPLINLQDMLGYTLMQLIFLCLFLRAEKIGWTSYAEKGPKRIMPNKRALSKRVRLKGSNILRKRVKFAEPFAGVVSFHFYKTHVHEKNNIFLRKLWKDPERIDSARFTLLYSRAGNKSVTLTSCLNCARMGPILTQRIHATAVNSRFIFTN
jgi:hypothetical protein